MDSLSIDAGPGDDHVEILAGNAILVDQTESVGDGARNDTSDTAYGFSDADSPLSTNTTFSGLTIDNPEDKDWYSLLFDAGLGDGNGDLLHGKIFLRSVAVTDGLKIRLYEQDENGEGHLATEPIGKHAGDVCPDDAGHLHDDHEYDQLLLIETEHHGAEDGGEADSHQDAVVVDQEGDDELRKFPMVLHSPKRAPQALEGDGQVGFARHDWPVLRSLVQPKKQRCGKEGEVKSRDDQR